LLDGDSPAGCEDSTSSSQVNEYFIKADLHANARKGKSARKQQIEGIGTTVGTQERQEKERST